MTNLKNMSAVLIAFAMMMSLSATATTLTFENITNNSTIDLSSQLSVESTLSSDGTGVEFTFTNDVGLASSISSIYFDLGTNSTLFTYFSIEYQSTGVEFSLDASTPNLPGGKTIAFTSDFTTDSDAPLPKNGIDKAGEYLVLLLSFGSGFDYNDYLADLASGNFKIGMHLIALSDGESDSYVNTVPVPAAGILFASALFGAGVFGRRKAKVNKSSMVGAFTRIS